MMMTVRTWTTGALLAMLAATGATGCSSSSGGGSGVTTGDSGTSAPTVDSGATSEEAGVDSAVNGCVYPSGPYGVTVGKVLNPNLQWQGFIPGATTPSTVTPADVYDCDGSKGINAVVVDSSGQWCVACQYVMQNLPTWESPKGDNWTKLGVQILNLVIQNNNYEPATITTAQQWRTQWKLENIFVVADPNDTFPTQSLPYELLVDPRTMKIVHDLSADTDVNNDGSDPAVATLAKKNATVK
jgi:hypothetical protein